MRRENEAIYFFPNVVDYVIEGKITKPNFLIGSQFSILLELKALAPNQNKNDQIQLVKLSKAKMFK
jgi:hypothetical protein